jgi:8-oxo-dGTP pyrophosphatase MutT (NUDIX family)
LRRQAVGSFRIFAVERIELEDADGCARGDAFTLRFPDWCNVVAVTPDDRVVLVWQYRFGSESLSLEIPGGVVDAGESPEDAARRELREETGYEAESLELLLTLEPNPALQANRCFTFLARGARATGRTGFDAQEELETALAPAARIGEVLEGGQVTHALVHSALETYWRKRGEGRC